MKKKKPPTLREGRRVIHLPLHFLSRTTKKNPCKPPYESKLGELREIQTPKDKTREEECQEGAGGSKGREGETTENI